jgi:hypothetical protein
VVLGSGVRDHGPGSFHATEAYVVAAGGDFTLAAGADHVAGAILFGAEERAAAIMDFTMRR